MSVIILTVDEVMRTLSSDDRYPFVVNDKEVDIVRFALNTGFTDVVLDEHSALRVMYQRPGETEVRAKTLTYHDTDGLRNYYDWQLLSADLTKKGTLTVALCILRTDSEVEEWHTTPCQVRVLDTIHTDDSDEGDETITPTVAQRVAVLETMIQRVASGAPIVVSSTSAMTDTNQIYVLSTNGRWYYHNGSAWVAGGEYGAVVTDTTLTQSGMPADAKAVGDEIAELKNELNTFDSIFDNPNVMDYNDSVLTTGLSVNITTGAVTAASVSVKDIIIPVEPEKTYTLLLPALNRGGVVAHNSKEFVAGTTYQKVNTNTAYSNMAIFTVPTGYSYILFHFYTGADFAGALEDFKLYEGQYAETEKNITLNDDAIPLVSVTSRKQGLSPIAYLFEDIYKLQNQNLTWNTGVSILLDGSVGNAGVSTDNVSDNVDVSAYDMVYIKASAGYTRLLYAFYDSNGTFILGKNSISTGYEDFAEYVKVPITAKYLKVAQSTSAGSSAGALSFVIGIYEKAWKGKKWVCIGDSLTQVNETSTKRYYEYVTDVTGISTENYGVGGTGYANPNGTAGNFIDRMASVPTDADVYTIFGSFNDVAYALTNNIDIGTASDTGTTTMCGYFNSALDALLARVPLANVGVVAPCPWQYCYPAGTGQNSTYGKAYVDALKEVCERRSIPFLDLFHFSGMRPWDEGFRTLVYTKDPGGGVHPNEIGHKILSTKFKAFLEYLM